MEGSVSSMVSPADKISLRTRFRAARREIAEAQRQHDDQSINRAIEALCAERRAVRIAGYLAFDGEPDISAALSRLNVNGVEIYLPVIVSHAGHSELHFRRWPAGGGPSLPGELRRNAFGIEEPMVGDHCTVNALDIMFIPLVAWDESGGRLGMGAGYYDRALEAVSAARNPLRIGIAYELQRADSVPVTERDVRLHGVLTESGLFTFGG